MAYTKKTGKSRVLIILFNCLTLSGLMLLPKSEARAQTFAEWFRQSSTQRKYLLQQIAALQVYSSYLRKGYAVAKGGLGSISGSLLSENGLHGQYYTSLRTVSPAVAANGQVKEIIRWQNDILLLTGAWNRIDGLDAAETRYLSAVKGALLADCTQLINTLQQVVSDGKMEMSDADRLKLIAKLHGQMQDNYRFASGFSAQAKAYAAQRRQEKGNVQALKWTYGIN